MTIIIEPADPTATIEEVVRLIVRAHDQLARFWSNSRGWAPSDVVVLFERCRLDRQTQLARCLLLWIDPGSPEVADGRLILARANLGALVEGAMQLGLAVFHNDYSKSSRASRREKTQGLIDAPDLMMNQLQIFYRDEFWVPEQARRWDPWTERVRKQRNAVHAFAERDLGTHTDFLSDLRAYLEFLAEINGRLPYPDHW